MNKTTQNRVGTNYWVTFPDHPSFDRKPHHLTIHQASGMHDVLEMHFGIQESFYYSTLKTGVPVQLTWTTDKAKGDFYGYITSVVVPSQVTAVSYVKVTAVATGFVLRNNQSKVWLNKTSSEIVTEIATSHQLKPCVSKDTFRYSQQSLNGLTNWEKVKELAERRGFVAQVYGATLHYHTIDDMVDEFITVIPALSFTDSQISPGGIEDAHTLTAFRPKVGEFLDSGTNLRTEKTISGINPITGKLFTTVSSPNDIKSLRESSSDSLFNRNMPTVVAETQTMAKELADAKARLSRFSVPADGVAQGDPRIAPYKTVEINGTGSVTDGFWIVTKATHFMTFNGKYTVDFSCVTDGTAGNKPTVMRPSKAGAVSTRNLKYEMAVTGAQKPSYVKLQSIQPLVKQTGGGYKRTPRRWVSA